MDSTFNLETAYRCAALSQRAYEAPNLTTPMAHVLVEEDADYLNIACRGTASIRDLITDADFVRVPMFVGALATVHRGCQRAVESVISSLIIKAIGVNKPVRLMGHSLGGMMCPRIASHFLSNQIAVADIYTFGEPRGGNAAFAALCDAQFGTKHHRVIHQEDIVCRIPGYLIGYRHSGHVDFIPSLGEGYKPAIWFDPGLEMRILSDITGIWRAWRAKRNILVLDDLLACHHVDSYVSALANLLTLSLADAPKAKV